MAYYAYILVSEKNGRRYFGSCEDLDERLKCHNAGKVKSTKGYRPYRLHYYETFNFRQEALAREKYFKTIAGYLYLKSKGVI